mmetsp:Transcript_95899/g.273421  ORF Transcript_95899/g.273421 Transcript_95899/m.273421 type:complete len:205 (+) Transcript_95899:116-730(+)
MECLSAPWRTMIRIPLSISLPTAFSIGCYALLSRTSSAADLLAAATARREWCDPTVLSNALLLPSVVNYMRSGYWFHGAMLAWSGGASFLYHTSFEREWLWMDKPAAYAAFISTVSAAPPPHRRRAVAAPPPRCHRLLPLAAANLTPLFPVYELPPPLPLPTTDANLCRPSCGISGCYVPRRYGGRPSASPSPLRSISMARPPW